MHPVRMGWWLNCTLLEQQLLDTTPATADTKTANKKAPHFWNQACERAMLPPVRCLQQVATASVVVDNTSKNKSQSEPHASPLFPSLPPSNSNSQTHSTAICTLDLDGTVRDALLLLAMQKVLLPEWWCWGWRFASCSKRQAMHTIYIYMGRRLASRGAFPVALFVCLLAAYIWFIC